MRHLTPPNPRRLSMAEILMGYDAVSDISGIQDWETVLWLMAMPT